MLLHKWSATIPAGLARLEAGAPFSFIVVAAGKISWGKQPHRMQRFGE